MPRMTATNWEMKNYFLLALWAWFYYRCLYCTAREELEAEQFESWTHHDTHNYSLTIMIYDVMVKKVGTQFHTANKNGSLKHWHTQGVVTPICTIRTPATGVKILGRLFFGPWPLDCTQNPWLWPAPVLYKIGHAPFKGDLWTLRIQNFDIDRLTSLRFGNWLLDLCLDPVAGVCTEHMGVTTPWYIFSEGSNNIVEEKASEPVQQIPQQTVGWLSYSILTCNDRDSLSM